MIIDALEIPWLGLVFLHIYTFILVGATKCV